MKYKRTKASGKEGVLVVEKVVADHGSIFRPVHEEDDVGIDGFIEPVKAEVVSGRLVGAQVKSGDSYLSDVADEFAVQVDEQHLKYWLDFMVPVILVCYSPSKKLAAWVSIRDYVENEQYHGRLPVKQIKVPFSRVLDVHALDSIAELARMRFDERTLLRCADHCVGKNAELRRQGFQILANHPDSRNLRITAVIARRLISDESIEVVKEALFILGYGVGRRRWSWNPSNDDEAQVVEFVSDLCSDLSEQEVYRLLTVCDDEVFRGPDDLGERLFDVVGCCWSTAERVCDRVAADQTEPMQRRANALYLLYECDDEMLEAAKDELLADPKVKDLAREIF